MSHFIFLFVFFLSFGTFLTLAFVRREYIGMRYFVYHGLFSAILPLIFYLILGESVLGGARASLTVYVLSAAIFSISATKNKWLANCAYATAVTAGVVTLVIDAKANAPLLVVENSLWVSFLVNEFLSVCLLGFTIATMCLGHWYLVQPKLPIEELKRLSLIFMGFVLVRLCLSTYTLGAMLGEKSELDMYRYLFQSSPGVFLVMRWAWGLVGPAVLSYFIWNTVKIRSTRSATGILYVAVMFVVTGEILSHYLSFYHGILV